MNAAPEDALTQPPGTEIATYHGADGARIRWLYGSPQDAGGTVVFLGGRTSFLEMHFDICRDFLSAGWAVAMPEFRGHGLSGRLLANRDKCHIDDFRTYESDVSALLDTVRRQGLPAPFHLVGYSMGGLVGLMHLAKHEEDYASLSLLAPMLGVRTRPLPQWLTRLVARVMVMLGQGGAYVAGRGDYDPGERDKIWPHLTSDMDRFDRSYAAVGKNRALAVAGPTWGWLDASFRAIREVLRDPAVRGLRLPVRLLLAEQDVLVRNAPAARLARHWAEAEVTTVIGARHNLLIERDPLRQQVLDAVLLHLLRCTAGVAATRDPEAP